MPEIVPLEAMHNLFNQVLIYVAVVLIIMPVDWHWIWCISSGIDLTGLMERS